MLHHTLAPAQIQTLAECIRALRDMHTTEISGKELELALLQEKLLATEEKLTAAELRLRITRNDLLHELLESESARRRLESENSLLKAIANDNLSKASESAELKEKAVEEKVEGKGAVGKGMKEKEAAENKLEGTLGTMDSSSPSPSPRMVGSTVITELAREEPDAKISGKLLQEAFSNGAPIPTTSSENTSIDDQTSVTYANTLVGLASLPAVPECSPRGVELIVPTFDGKFYEWKAWLQALKARFEADSELFLTEESKIEYMRSYLKQGPLLQATALPPGVTADTLLRRLELRFGPTPNRIKQAKEEVEMLKLRMQAEETLLEFLARFLPVIEALGADGKEKIRSLRRNLPESLASKIEDVLYGETFDEFVIRCKEVDLELRN